MANYWVIFKVFRGLCVFFVFFLSASISIASVNNVEFRFSLLSALSNNSEVIEFYEENNFKPIWVGGDRSARERRSYFLNELKNTSRHALPTLRYDARYLKIQVRNARTATELGLVEALITSKFLEYSSNIQTGILKPASVDKEIVRKIPYMSASSYLKTLLSVTPRAFFKSLYPQSKQYSILLMEKTVSKKLFLWEVGIVNYQRNY